MTRRKALAIAISVAGLSGLIFVLLLMSKPVPAVSHASYAWKPGCHCGKPAAAKPAATTTAKPTTTTAKATTTTAKAKATTSTAKKATTTTSGAKAATTSSTKASTATSAKTSTKSSTKASAGKTTSTTKRAKLSTTTTGAGGDDQSQGLALGAAIASFPGGGDGGSSGGAGGSGDGSAGLTVPGDESAAGSSGPPHYYLSPVAIGFLLVYGVSFVLYRTKRLRVVTHRKVWNVLLLATFLLCGILGLALAVGVTRNPPLELPTWLLVWHVETGIVMSFISVFHIGWHLRYYLAMVIGKRRAGRPEKAAAAERNAGRERARRPRAGRPVLVRTEEERMLAFQERQAARASQAWAGRPASAPSDAERWLEEAKRRVAPAT